MENLARVANEFNKDPHSDDGKVDYKQLLINSGGTGALLVVISHMLKNGFKSAAEQIENLQKNTQLAYEGPISRDGEKIEQNFGVYGIIPGELDKNIDMIATVLTR